MLPKLLKEQRWSRFLLVAGGLLVAVAMTVGASRTAIPASGRLSSGLDRLGRFDFFERGQSLPRGSRSDDPSGPPTPGTGPAPTADGQPEGPFPQLAEVLDFERMVEKRPGRVPVEVHGLYLTGYIAGQTEKVNLLLKALDGTSFNAFVIDVKNDSGRISYRSDVPLTKAAGAGTDWIQEPGAYLAHLRDEGIYTIARIVVFKDPALARVRPDLAVQSQDGGPWRDRTGATWLDPYRREVWDYAVALAQEAARKGFREIQFDYVRFPSDGETGKTIYSDAEGSRAETIGRFLKYAYEHLQPYDVYLSADIFGLVGTVTDDMGIGQRLEDILGTVDYISPMVYPSHYSARNYGLEDPESRPYETVLAGLRDYQRRMELAPSLTKIRPWLQDFSLRVHYGEAEVEGQIKAARELGVNEFILWNPGNVYNTAVFREVSRPSQPSAESPVSGEVR